MNPNHLAVKQIRIRWHHLQLLQHDREFDQEIEIHHSSLQSFRRFQILQSCAVWNLWLEAHFYPGWFQFHYLF